MTVNADGPLPDQRPLPDKVRNGGSWYAGSEAGIASAAAGTGGGTGGRGRPGLCNNPDHQHKTTVESAPPGAGAGILTNPVRVGVDFASEHGFTAFHAADSNARRAFADIIGDLLPDNAHRIGVPGSWNAAWTNKAGIWSLRREHRSSDGYRITINGPGVQLKLPGGPIEEAADRAIAHLRLLGALPPEPVDEPALPPVPGDAEAPKGVPAEEAYRDHNGRIWVASGGGNAGPRKLYLSGWEHGIAIDGPTDLGEDDKWTKLADAAPTSATAGPDRSKPPIALADDLVDATARAIFEYEGYQLAEVDPWGGTEAVVEDFRGRARKHLEIILPIAHGPLKRIGDELHELAVDRHHDLRKGGLSSIGHGPEYADCKHGACVRRREHTAFLRDLPWKQ